MKRIITLVAIVGLFVVQLVAQTPQPVKWTFSNVSTGKHTGEIVATATIESGWHMYGLTLPKGGPQPTTFTLTGAEGINFSNEIVEMPAPTKFHDSSWNMELNWWESKVTLKRAYKVTGKGGDVEVKIRYMVCNGDRCLPPTTITHKFSVK